MYSPKYLLHQLAGSTSNVWLLQWYGLLQIRWFVKLKISREEWDYRFHFSFSEVWDFVKGFWDVEISYKKQTKISCFFCKCFLMLHFILKPLPQIWHLQLNQVYVLQGTWWFFLLLEIIATLLTMHCLKYIFPVQNLVD